MSTAELRTLEVFADFPDHDLSLLSGICRMLTFPAEAAIIEQGEKARAAFILLGGEVEVIRRLPGGNRTSLGALKRGAVFGAVGLLDGGPRAASCRAKSDCRVMELSGADFQRLSEASTPLGARFLMVVCRQLVRDLRATNVRIAELASLATLDPMDVAASVGGSLL